MCNVGEEHNLGAERKLTNGNRNTLYTSNVNPIATFPNTGVVVFGQKTLLAASSALDRVNVRRLLIDIRRKVNKPIYQSTVRTNKHTDPVWQVL